MPNSFNAGLQSASSTACSIGQNLSTTNGYNTVRHMQGFSSVYQNLNSNAIYPRFPPYDRMEARTLSQDNNSYYRHNLTHGERTSPPVNPPEYTNLATSDIPQFSNFKHDGDSSPFGIECHTNNGISNPNSPSPVSPGLTGNNSDSGSNPHAPVYPWMRSQYGENIM